MTILSVKGFILVDIWDSSNIAELELTSVDPKDTASRPPATETVSKAKTPPALAAWSFNFDLKHSFAEKPDTTDFSRVEFQLQPNESKEKRLKWKLHATKVGGVSAIIIGSG